MSPKDKASVSTEMIEREDTVAMVRFVLRSTYCTDTLMLLYPGRRRNKRLSGPRSPLRRHCTLIRVDICDYLTGGVGGKFLCLLRPSIPPAESIQFT